MNTYPKSLTRFLPNLVHIAAIPVFFLISALIFEPKALCALMSAGEGISSVQGVQTFNTVITFAILLGVMTATRLTFYFLRKRIPMQLDKYVLWCLGEILLCCAFTALYLVLMAQGEHGYFSWLGRCLTALGSTLLFPYLILTMLYGWLNALYAEPSDGDLRLKFYDNRHQLKFITEASSVLYVESNENYIIIHYLENGIEKRFQLRNSMKNIEPLCERAGFARTHRCFIVNPRHIKTIRKDTGGMNFADLGCERSEGIPISKKYHDSIARML